MHHVLLFLLGAIPVVSSFQTNFDHEHDSGIYSRLGLGLAFVSLLGSEFGDSSGVGVAPEFTMGGYIAERLVLGVGARAAISRSVVRLNAGPSITFYPTDSIYIALQIGPELGNDRGSLNQWAIGSEISLGWLGWIGRESQLGTTAFLAGETLDLDGDETTLSGWRAGVRLTFTHN